MHAHSLHILTSHSFLSPLQSSFYPYLATENASHEPSVTSQLPDTMVFSVLVSLSLLMASDKTDNSIPLDITFLGSQNAIMS